MPTLNEYTSDNGYYILARPSDSGNITYQLKPRGEQIVEKLDYKHGEEIGWQVINALRVPGLVYTGDEGTTDDNMIVDLNNEEIDALSEEDARQLLDELSSVPRIGESQMDNIEQVLGIGDNLDVKFDDYLTEVMDVVEKTDVVENSRTKNISDSSTMAHFMATDEDRDGETRMCGTSIDLEIKCGIDIIDGSQQDGGAWGDINIFLSRSRGIVEYNSQITLEPGNSGEIVNYQCFLSEILFAIISGVEKTQLDQYTDN